MQIYLVVGNSGSYSDHAEWPVRAFLYVSRANEFCDSLPKIWEDLLRVRPEDEIEAQRLQEERIANHQKMQDGMGVRNADRLPIPAWLQSPNPQAAARDRAAKQMREYDPCFNGGDTGWYVTEVELEE